MADMAAEDLQEVPRWQQWLSAAAADVPPAHSDREDLVHSTPRSTTSTTMLS